MSFRENLKSFFTSIFLIVFPLTRAKSLSEFALINNNYDAIGSFIQQLPLVMFYTTILMTSFKVPFLLILQPLRSPVYGAIGHQCAILEVLGFSEVIFIKIWLYLLVRKHGSLEKIKFIRLLHKLDKRTHDSIFYWSKIFFVQLTLSCFAFDAILYGRDLLLPKNLANFIVTLFHFSIHFQVVRIPLMDLLVLYVYSFAGLKVVLRQLEQLKHCIAHQSNYFHPSFAILIHYSALMKSIDQLNSCSGVLMLASKMLVIPFGSLLFVLAATPTDDLMSTLLKVAALAAASAFACHGYFLITILSKVDTKSKRLSSTINSLIARRKTRNYAISFRLKTILEDLSCLRSRLAVFEFSGKVTQMDVFDSVISTLSILTLLLKLTRKIIERF